MPGKSDLIPTRYSLLSRLENWDDEQSWKDFFDTYWRLIYGVAIAAGLTDSEAQDVVQETVICVAKEIQKFKKEPQAGSFKGWLRNIIRWRIADQLRKRLPTTAEKRGPSGEGPLESVLDPASFALDAVWEQEWDENLLHAAIDRVKHRVKEEQFQMYDLYALKNWSVSKVADTLGVSIGAVYLSKHRVGSQIRKEIHLLEKHLF